MADATAAKPSLRARLTGPVGQFALAALLTVVVMVVSVLATS